MITATARKINKFECYEKLTTDDLTEFVQFNVEIDISKSLIRGIRKKINDSGMWIPFSYESLLLFCFNFGTIGHFVKSCMATVRDGNLDLQFGSKIKVMPLR